MKGYLANEDLFRHEFFIHPLHQIPITENEYNQAISDALSYFVSIKEIIDEILSLSYYIKFSDEELASMALFINDIRYMIGDIEREDPSIYIEDYINMDIVISEIL